MSTPTTAFRRPRNASQNATGAMARALEAEWEQITDHTPATLLTRWAHREPVLVGLTSPQAIVDQVHTCTTYETRDQTLLALIRLSQAGQQLAGRIVLQCLLPSLLGWSQRPFARSKGPVPFESREQARHSMIAAFWQALATYPLHRSQKVASNLMWCTVHVLDDERDSALDHEVPTDTLPHDEPAPTDPTDYDVDELIGWTQQRGTITADEATMLRMLYTGDGSTYEAITTTYQITYATARQRVSRARKRMIADLHAHHPDISTLAA